MEESLTTVSHHYNPIENLVPTQKKKRIRPPDFILVSNDDGGEMGKGEMDRISDFWTRLSENKTKVKLTRPKRRSDVHPLLSSNDLLELKEIRN